MPIPDFQSLMLPLLEYAADGKDHTLAETRSVLAKRFSLTPEEEAQLLPSGRNAVFGNRIAWAKVYLQMAALLTSPQRGHFRISDRGVKELSKKPDRITIKYLERFPEFTASRSSSTRTTGKAETKEIEEVIETPEETLETAYARLRTNLVGELLARVKSTSFQFFERLVIELLVKMGYGGSRLEAGQALGQSGDEGIDGVINEDRLGLDAIYVQAKKWEGTVGRPEIQKFVGALHGKHARKGVFITTGNFTKDSIDYVSRIDSKVVLIDGRKLTELMIDFNVGVTTVEVYAIKRIDSDYFTEE